METAQAAEVAVENADIPSLMVTFGATNKKTRALTKTTTLLGRSRNADVKLDAPEVAPVHCVITRMADKLMIRDCDSRTGTIVNGQPVREAELNDQDSVQVGPFTFAVRLPIRGLNSAIVEPGVDPAVARSLAERAGALERAEQKLAAEIAEWQNLRAVQGDSDGRSSSASAVRAELEAGVVAPLRAEVERLTIEASDLRSENDQLRATALNAAPAASSSEIDELRRQLAEAQDQRNRLSEELSNYRGDAERRLAAIRSDLDNERQRIKDLMKQAAAQFSAKPAAAAAPDTSGMQQRIDELQVAMENMQYQLAGKQQELEAALAAHASAQPAMPDEVREYEAQLNSFRTELEHAQLRLQDQEAALNESIKQGEIQMSRERAELSRERALLERTRSELKTELEHAEREAKNFEKMASINKLTQEFRGQGRGAGGQGSSTEAPDSASLQGRIRGFLKRIGEN